MEMLAYTYHHNFGMHIICLRYFNVYGENNRPGMAPYKWTKAFLTGEEIELSGEGTRKRDFTYVGNIVDATIRALESSLDYEVINIADSKPHSLMDLFVALEKVTGISPQIRKRPSHPASVEEMHADNSKAKELLKWEPEVSFEEGIKRLVAWFRANRLEELK
jgi:UDP-glucuronate 4-epimerase